MIKSRRIKGILFDSGDTLVRPKGGKWWPAYYFRKILTENGIQSIHWNQLKSAQGKGMQYLNEHHYLRTEDEEREQFKVFYRIVLEELHVPFIKDSVLLELADAAVNQVEFEPFPETILILEKLRDKGLLLGIVSNAWPSLEKKYRLIGLRRYFDTFVISALEGCTKPCERIYEKAMKEMSLSPESLLFVDDVPVYVKKAIEMGMNGVVVSNYGLQNGIDMPYLSSLSDIEMIV